MTKTMLVRPLNVTNASGFHVGRTQRHVLSAPAVQISAWDEPQGTGACARTAPIAPIGLKRHGKHAHWSTY